MLDAVRCFECAQRLAFVLDGLEVEPDLVLLELGGNAGVIVDRTADVGWAVKRSLVGAFAYAGQVCISVQRMFVARSIWDAFMERFVEAAAGIATGDPLDPDYRTPWPGGQFTSVTSTDDAIVVEVPDESWLEAGTLDADLAALATQQLVYTLQGVVGERLPVTVEYDGKPAATLLGVDVSKGLKARPQLDVLAFVNITEPAEGSTVGATFTANGRASSFEATVPWEIQDSTGTVVLSGFATADGWLDKLHPWETPIDASSLEPGDYTFIARTDDPSDGEGGGPTEDTKRITIE